MIKKTLGLRYVDYLEEYVAYMSVAGYTSWLNLKCLQLFIVFVALLFSVAIIITFKGLVYGMSGILIPC